MASNEGRPDPKLLAQLRFEDQLTDQALVSSRMTKFTDPCISKLNAAAKANFGDDPNYYVTNPRSLFTTSTVHTFTTGTGDAIYQTLVSLLESTNEELILVTCYWARSRSLDTLNDILRRLSDKAIRRGSAKIRVRLCFSSLSFFQKLFHKQSVTGQTWDTSTWVKKLGLPHPDELGGLDLEIKSIFLLPFSVMHPKFMIIDRKMVALPSCNISWEEWFEGCITFSGPIVGQFLQFYSAFWERNKTLPNYKPLEAGYTPQIDPKRSNIGHGNIITRFHRATRVTSKDIPTFFLPSPHRRNPQFRPFSHPDKVLAPPTPLNAFVLSLLEKAEHDIWIQTPNLTSPPILSAILRALSRGIHVRILTSEKLMVLEQLVTAGTTTSRCVNKLIKRYEKLSTSNSDSKNPAPDEEALYNPGHLQIYYFTPPDGLKPRGREEGEPQQSHLKMVIVDGEALVLGSGNMDRASWFTSQELGVAFFDRSFAQRVAGTVDDALHGRTRKVYDSHL